jgi:CYTH domain-containing protein
MSLPDRRTARMMGRMADEIERKFLMAAVPDAPVPEPGVQLRQGYLAIDGAVEVRVRLMPEADRLTVKAGAGLTRTEVELQLDPADSAALWVHTVGRRVEKTRHRVDLDAGLVAEIDRYEGALEGLSTVEVEFPNAQQAEAFDPPAWFGQELTGDPRWSNAELARRGVPK